MLILKTVLKDYSRKVIKHDMVDKHVEEFRKQLEENGWYENILEGGMISPDESTIFYYNREPYVGMLDLYDNNKIEEYDNMCKELKKYFTKWRRNV